MTPLGRLHLITDTRPGRDPVAVVAAALAASGAAAELVVQVRLPDSATDRQAYELTLRVRDLCAPVGVPVLVNDRLHVAVAAGVAGGHVGADDLPVAVARRVVGSNAILGATARTPESAAAAARSGASYLGVGPAYDSATKPDLAAPIGPSGIGAVAAVVPCTPVVAIGGVTAAAVPALVGAGAHGVAVIAAVADAADPTRAVAQLLTALVAAGGARG